jgi:hypothetical protein
MRRSCDTAKLNGRSVAVLAGSVKEGRRTIWELGGFELFDGGPDGDADTHDNTLFAVQGLFAP